MSERLQNKMYDYEVTPPPGVWEKIAEALDESELIHEFPSKLYGIEITPPDAAWDKIKNSLAEEQVESPTHKKTFPIFRYAVAAAIVGLIVLGGIQLLKSKSSDNKIVLQDKNSESKDSIIPQSINEGNTSTEIKDDDTALEGSKQTLAKLDIPVSKKIKSGSKNYFIQSALQANITPEEAKEVANRYIAVMTPDCNVVRISKKLDHLVCCVAGDDLGAVCKDQMQEWREKIARSSIAASPANFMDIVSLVSFLQDND